KEWNKNYTSDIVINKTEYSAENYLRMGKKYISDYYKRFHPFDQLNILGIETDDTLDLGDGMQYYVRIDKFACKGDEYFICDYKTRNSMKDQEEADKDRQLAMYAVWVKKKYPDAKKINLVWHMLKFDKDVYSERTDEQLRAVTEETVGLIKSIESCTSWPTSKSKLCDYCDFKAICPEFVLIPGEGLTEEEAKEEPITSEEAESMVDELASVNKQAKELEVRSKELESKIILFAKQSGNKTIQSKKASATVSVSKEIQLPEDKTELIALLKERGQYEACSVLNYSRVRSEMFKDKLDPEIARIVPVVEKYSLKMKKNEKEEAR
ncbi:MAG: PD-(D/E)XK nuclease family protein, partial [Candidatus Methanoplasma sp.]|nr:PD-(D/E)XK nuclease family protein [Candidatus Methanoplasma sp.]